MFLSSFVVFGAFAAPFFWFTMQLSSESPFSLLVSSDEHLRGYQQGPEHGPLGIFLPGFASDLGGSKSTLLAQHAARSRWGWLRFDYRGMGLSDGSFAELSISRYLADLEAILAHFAQRPTLLVGSSMGGWVATLAAHRHPEQIQGAVLIAPAFNFIQQYFERLDSASRQTWRDRGIHHWSLGPGGPSFPLQFTAVRDAMQYDPFQNPPMLPMPIHILHGSEDEAVPLLQSYAFMGIARGRNRALEVLHGIDHRLQGAERPLLQAVERLWSYCFG